MNEHGKKRDYNSSILNVEQGPFTPPAFLTQVVWGKNAQCLSNSCIR